MSEKIKTCHLFRKAILYVRQSSAHQVLHNRESRALQYAMRDRLTALGWSEIETVDDDLGCSAAWRRLSRWFRAHGGRGLPRQGRRRRSARGVALCSQQPRLAATDRDVPCGGYGACRPGDGLCSAGRQRPPAARPQREPQRVRTRSVAAALAGRPSREGTAGRTHRHRADRLREGWRPAGEGSGQTCPGGDPSGLRQGGRTRQRAPSPPVLPRARSRSACPANQRRRHLAPPPLWDPPPDDRKPGLRWRLCLW